MEGSYFQDLANLEALARFAIEKAAFAAECTSWRMHPRVLT